jgi:hypothetical protein
MYARWQWLARACGVRTSKRCQTSSTKRFHGLHAGLVLAISSALGACADPLAQPAGSDPLIGQFPDEAEAAHDRFGRPCKAELAKLQVVHALSQREAQDLCESSEKIVGCTRVDLYPLPTVILNDEHLQDERSAVTHEMMHFLLICSGKDPSGDPGHRRLPIWGLHGTLAAVNTEVFHLPE